VGGASVASAPQAGSAQHRSAIARTQQGELSLAWPMGIYQQRFYNPLACFLQWQRITKLNAWQNEK
jgi:hypothetical protein